MLVVQLNWFTRETIIRGIGETQTEVEAEVGVVHLLLLESSFAVEVLLRLTVQCFAQLTFESDCVTSNRPKEPPCQACVGMPLRRPSSKDGGACRRL